MDSDIYLQRADTDQAKQEVYALRYQAYRAIEAIYSNQQELFSDEYDDRRSFPNIFSYLLRKEEGLPVGSIRACVYSPLLKNKIPAFDAYFDEIKNNLGLDKVIVESNRFTVTPAFQANENRYHICLFKAISINVILANADYLITSVRKKHVAFYQKILKMQPISEEKIYNFNYPTVLLAGDVKQFYANVAEKLPIIKPTTKEIDEYQKCGILRF